MRASIRFVFLMVIVLAIGSAGCGREKPTTLRAAADRATHGELPKSLTLALGNKVTMKLRVIPAGKFMMGSPEGEQSRCADETQHEVTIGRPFYMGVYDVTQEQYQAVMGKERSMCKGPTYPADSVSWDEAVDFCKKLSAKTGKPVRLPTEAEWEYSCRAGTMMPFNTGKTLSVDQARCCDPTSPNGDYEYFETTPVGSFQPNAWGLYDMHGNVWQWCSDWFGDYPTGPVTDPVGPVDGNYRVVRGGRMCSEPEKCRSARRDVASDDTQGVGFRVVVEDSSGPPIARPAPEPFQYDNRANRAAALAAVQELKKLQIPLSLSNKYMADRLGNGVASGGNYNDAALVAVRRVLEMRVRQAKGINIPPAATQPVAVPASSASTGTLATQPDGAKSLTLDLGNKVTMKLALIPAGKFLMGSPKDEWFRQRDETLHQVTIGKPFFMGIYPVTQEQYQAVMDKNPSWFKGATNPVEEVSDENAVEFCKKLTARTGKKVRLPTEAEWEYACRAGTRTAFNTGKTIRPDQANYRCDYLYIDDWIADVQGEGVYRDQTTPVGTFQPNAWGLYDMHGNVWQRCYRCIEDSPVGQVAGPPKESVDDSEYTIRGGCWMEFPWNCRSGRRSGIPAGGRYTGGGGYFGFRVVVADSPPRSAEPAAKLAPPARQPGVIGTP
jgi:formylglycine-generating enzyme required for sulfatase activity